MRVSEHLFVREHVPMDFASCRHCGMPDQFCRCNPEEEELPRYLGADPTRYTKEKN